MISTGELKKGVAIELDGELWQILDYHHIKMGRGSAQVSIKLRNIKRGQTVERTFQAGEKWPRAYLDRRPVQFLYKDGADHHFMDTESYEQLSVPPASLGSAADYLLESASAVLQMYGDEIVGVDLPASVELTVAETEPGVQGDRVSAARKPATLETGKVIQVPLFVNVGDKLKVDTRTGDYITRA